MKIKYIVLFLFILIASVSLLPSKKIGATVGGPTFIYDFKYNPTNESVYYVKQNFGGRGCPPELIKLSLNSGKISNAYSCDEGMEIMSGTNFDTSLVNAEINRITKDFKYLVPLSLKDNKISIDINFKKEESYSEEDDGILRRHFTASVYQNGTKVVELPIEGCNLNQPFTFQGYSIPGFEKKIVLLLSTRGDCFEGGYINETLHIVGGVENLNKTTGTNFYKGLSALTPNEGNLVVFQSDTVNDKTPDSPTQAQEKKSPTNIILFSVIFLLAGSVLGIVLYKVLANKNRI